MQPATKDSIAPGSGTGGLPLAPAQATLLSVASAILISLFLVTTHFQQVLTIEKAHQALDRLRDAEEDVLLGLLEVTLDRPGSWGKDRERGEAHLDQARTLAREFVADWAKVFPSAPTMTDLEEEFQRSIGPLQALIAGAEGSARPDDLRAASALVDQVANQMDTRALRSVAELSVQLNTNFLVLEAIGLGLVVVLSGFLFFQGRGRQKAEARLQQVVQGANVGLWHRDVATARIEVSETWNRMMGRGPSDPAPTVAEWTQRIHPDDRTPFLQALQGFEQSEQTQFSAEFRLQSPEGSPRWILTVITATRDSRGNPVELFGTNVDVTQRKLLEAEKATLTAQVLQAQKTQAIGRLAGGIAHDLNNLLVPILAYAEMGLKGLGKKSPSAYFTQIKAGVEKAAGLTRQILAFSRQQVLERRPLDLNTLVVQFESILRRTIREDIEIHIDLAPGLPPILADPGQVEQVLLNLAVNARDAMAHGGLLTIETAYDPGGSPARVVLGVTDTGVGIPPEVQTHIFEPFFTTKARGEGTGLGLSTVQGIVEQHGGSITVQTQVGEGSTFRVSWPSTSLPVVPSPPWQAPPGGTETLMVVEDDEAVRAVVVEALTGQGYRVHSTSVPGDALHVGDPYDLLVTDVVMPGMNGRELHQALRVLRPDLKVLFISGYTDQILSESEDATQGFLQKPFSMDALARKVRELLDR